MFRKKRCEKCQAEIDPSLEACPYCESEKLSIKKRIWGNKTIYLHPAKQIVFFGVGWGGLSLLGIIFSLIVKAIVKASMGDPNAAEEFLKSVQYSAIINFSLYAMLVVALLLITFKDITKLLKSFKNFLVPISAAAGFFGVIMFNIIYNSILLACGIDLSSNSNEQTLDSIITVYPLLSIIIFGIVGPLCEEITYRLGLYSFLRRINKYLAFVITIVVFALIHFDFTGDMFIELLNLPFYIVAGFTMTFIYEKVGFGGSFAMHSLNNLFSVISQIILSSQK